MRLAKATQYLLVGCFITQAWAHEQPANTKWVFSLSAGPDWASNGEKQTFFLDPGVEKTYDPDVSTDLLFNGEFFTGIQGKLYPSLYGQLGLAVSATNSASLDGDVWDDADPNFSNYTYSYKIQHTQLGVKGKLIYDNSILSPWISASLGVGFNHAYDYDNVPTIEEAVANSNFTSNTETAFSYTIGVGVQRNISENMQLGLGYEFSDWGKSELGRAPGQTMNNGITLDNFYTSALMFSVNYYL